MTEVISAHYYAPVMALIHQKIEDRNPETIIWFGDCHMVSLVYDYLAADGYLISVVLDNDEQKMGKIIQRDWCMPFSFHYVELEKETVDEIVTGHPIKELMVDIPHNIGKYTKNIRNTLFFMLSLRSCEMKKQLMAMGADEANVVELSTEGQLINRALEYLDTATPKKEVLSTNEHKKLINNILRSFKAFCEEKKLRYFLAYGTLLGAVRHRGFIPWDDDIDILMPVEDYKRFISSFPRNGRFEVLDISTNDSYFFPFAKLVDNNTYLRHDGCPIIWMQGAYIDIFPVSGFQEGISFLKQWKYHTQLDVKWYWFYISKDILLHPISDCRADVLSQKWKVKFDEAKEVGVLTTIPAKPWILSRKLFESVRNISFEGDEYHAPIGYDEYLTALYGNYWILPPAEEQRIHGFPSYTKVVLHDKKQ